MASIVLLAHPVKCTQQQFNDSLKSLVDSRTALVNLPSVLPQIDASKIKQCVFGPNHLAFLMEDGRVCRVSFQLSPETATACPNPKETSSDEEVSPPTCAKKTPTATSSTAGDVSSTTFTLSSGETFNIASGIARWTNQRVAITSSTGSTASTSAAALASRAVTTRGRGRIIRAARGRNGTGWLNSRAVIPASAVPEELISQAQIVLQGKSRQVIIRELQKTSLDVNLAVNNLLSRDDDDPEEGEEDYIQEAYLPSDLISIFEAGIPNDEPFVLQRDAIFGEDNLYQSSNSYSRGGEYRPANSAAAGESSSARDTEREENSVQMRDRWWGMLTNESKEKLTTPINKAAALAANSKSKLTASVIPADTAHVFGEVVWWKFKEESADSIKFSHIASLHTELLAVTENGFLHKWKWSDKESPVTEISGHCHPRTKDLNLTDDERVVKIAACNVRVSILTESGKIATWLDDTLAVVGHKMEHPLQLFTELKGLTVSQLSVCDHYSCVQLANGSLYWWGVFPFEQRKKILDKVKAKAKKSAITGSGLIKPDTQVCIRSCPLYYPGAVGFTTVNGKPRVGELQEQAWTIAEKCRFKILDDKSFEKDVEIPEEVNQEQPVENMDTTENVEKQTEGDSTAATPTIASPTSANVKSRKRKLGVGNKSSSSKTDKTENVKEEEWCLRDVIFVEEVRNVPIGKVLKVDGAYALVHFSPQVFNTQDVAQTDVKNLLNESRLLRKDELQIVKWTTPPKMPECFQKTPKQLNTTFSSKVLAFTLDKKGVHAVMKSSTGLRYTTFSLASGRAGIGGHIQPEPSSFLSRNNSLSLHSSGAGSLVVMKDPNDCIYPLIKDNLGGMQNPNITNILPTTCLTMSKHHNTDKSQGDTQLNLTLLVLKENPIIKNILRTDSDFLLHDLKSIEGDEDCIDEFANTKCDGNRNIIHVCVSSCKPISTKQAKLLNSLTTLGLPALDPLDKNEEMKDGSFDNTMWEPIFDGLACLEILLSNCILSKYIKTLLSERDAFGCTPFMSAVLIRAYPAATKIYNSAVAACTEDGVLDKELFTAMICPLGTDPNLSPIQVLCCNDTCSFTWTGTRHINQDIFECKTCGLVGPLCCCTECAQVCHIGHECKLKRTSPTAYCDCWEKCPCKSLVAGDQTQRVALLHRLVDETDLCTRPNKKGQHILLFLAQTVARQSNEQMQYMPNRSATDSSKRGSTINRSRVRAQSPPIEQLLEPPKFAKISLLYMLKNWVALKSMVFFGQNENSAKKVHALDENIINTSLLQSEDMIKYLNHQNGSSQLDNFVHKLIVKCSFEFLDTLIQSLTQHIKQTREASLLENTKDYDEAITVAKRFLHAVIRVYVVLSACTSSTATKRKGVLPSISKCKRVFSAFNYLAAPEIARIAATIFSPVRQGVVYPASPFTMATSTESINACDEFFSMNPLPARSPTSSSPTTQPRVRFAQDNPSVAEEMDTENSSQSRNSVTEDDPADLSHVQESDMELDLMAESDSDSDESNHGDSTIQQANNSNSDLTTSSSSRRNRVDGYFSLAEASETEGEEEDGVEEEDEEEEDDDDDEDENNESSEQRTGTAANRDNNTPPHALQWAFRNPTTSNTSSNASATASNVTGSGLVYMDTAQLRRSGGAASADGAAANSMYSTPSALARTFAILIRELSDLLNCISDTVSLFHTPPSTLADRKMIIEAKDNTDGHLKATWEWLWNIMETTEAQLRFGASITAVSDPNHPQHPFYDNQVKTTKPATRTATNFGNPLRALSENRRKKRAGASAAVVGETSNGRQDYLTYLLSLMRSQDGEHGDSLPTVEITSLRHVAFVLDAFIYYLRATQEMELSEGESSNDAKVENSPCYSPSKPNKADMNEFRVSSAGDRGSILKSDIEDDVDDGEMTDDQEINNDEEQYVAVDVKVLRQTFFKRSDSTLVLGHEPADPFNTVLREALPLADRPQLLNPTARRDQLFGVMKNTDRSNCPEPSLSMKLNADHSKSDAESSHLSLSPNIYLGRWHMCLELFGRVFLDDVGAEANSVLNELGRYDVKEAKFKRDMEKLRTTHQKDLYVEGLDRNRNILLQQALRQLNSQFGRRLPGAGPLNIQRLKVSFKEEQGEGSGVMRSFFTAISNAFLSDEKLPNLDNIFSGSRGLTHQLRARAKERERERRRSGSNALSPGLIPRVVRRNERASERAVAELENCVLSLDSPSYQLPVENDDNEDEYTSNPIPHHKRELGRRINKKVNAMWPEHASKITGMLLEFTPTQLVYLLTHDASFKDKINEAADMITSANNDSAGPSSQETPVSSGSKSESKLHINEEEESDNNPLFFQPGKPGYYSPRPGKCSPERLNCFRNVGRVIGLCLLQNEISPLSFNRHVIKYLLGRRVNWHDLAFFDPTLYESLRQLIADSSRSDHTEIFNSLELNYSIQLRPEEGGSTVDLISGGSQVEVAADNVHDYVKRYAEYRMIGNARRALQAMRRGLLDVIPAFHLDGLTAEDFRLLLNGAGEINIRQLMNYTFFSDETAGEGQEKLTKFKKWFWSMVENMTHRQKQDLLYFWTSSPAMPASAEGFQPMPSVTVKPANDHQLPTANTCISRLYVPLYSSKTILRSKFLLAIKTKVFGFV